MKLTFALTWIFWWSIAQAQQTPSPLISLHGPAQPQTRATEMTVDVIVLNPGTEPLVFTPHKELVGKLRAEQRTWVVGLRYAPPAPVTILTGQFISIPYRLMLPVDVSGQVMLEIAEAADLRLIVKIREHALVDEERVSGTPLESLEQKETRAPPAMTHFERTFANRLGIHEPIYFLYGPEAPAAKFQLSFKYRLIGENSKFGDLIPPFRGFYVAYTQRSLWDLDADSSPFYDTSYMPELFFEWLAPENLEVASGVYWLGMQTGVRHESNGKADEDSRSMHLATLRTGVIFGSLNGWQLIVSPEVFSYLGTSEENKDIAHYRGYGELGVALASKDSWQLRVATHVGTKSNRGSLQIDLTRPVRIPLINLETLLQLQYFHGYGESFLNYNQKSSVWRVGMGFVR